MQKSALRMKTQTTSTIAAGVLQGDILAPYLFIICLERA